MLNKLHERLEHFWFGGEARGARDVLQILWCVLVLEEILVVWRESFSDIFTNGGPFRGAPVFASPWWNGLGYFDDLTSLSVALGILIVALILTIVATVKQSRWVAGTSLAIAWFLLVCFHSLAPLVFMSNERILRFVGLCLAAASCFKANPKWAIRLIQLQYSLVWLSGAAFKVIEPAWQSGEAILQIVQMNDLTTGLTKRLLDLNFLTPEVFRVMTWSVPPTEFFLAWGFYFQRTRKTAFVLGFALHGAFMLFMRIACFQEVMFFGLLAFFDWDTVRSRKTFLQRGA